jgi:hypothetical protein
MFRLNAFLSSEQLMVKVSLKLRKHAFKQNPY